MTATKRHTVETIKKDAYQEGHDDGFNDAVDVLVKRMLHNVECWKRYNEGGLVPLGQPKSMSELATVFQGLKVGDSVA